MFGWQFIKRVTVPGSGNITVELPAERPILDCFTVWASSGGRTVANLSFQLTIGGVNFGSAVNVVGAVAGGVVADLGAQRRVLPSMPRLPYPSPDNRNPDTLPVRVVITNADATAADVTILASGVAHPGG